ncbi:MAG: general secretion pathway protein GspK [Betaproteobacteria bacterium]|nr:general secretion pathway protein GspK [Betaproteobacteria bacterium]
MARSRPPRYEQGIALILVLWVMALLTLIAGSLAYSMRTEALVARNAVAMAQARAAADGAVFRAIYEASRPQNTAEAWKRNGQEYVWQSAGSTLRVRITDESGKIDLNTAAEPLMLSVLQRLGGLGADEAARLLDAIVDWRDADDLRRPNGAEESDYRAAGRTYKPANAPFESIADLQRVLGVTPALYARLAPYLTVQSRQSGIHALYAAPELLLALPGATPEQVAIYVAQRQEALASGAPVPPFPAAAAFAAGESAAFQVRAEARTGDGVLFVREAVVRLTGNLRQPPIFMIWREGSAMATKSGN